MEPIEIAEQLVAESEFDRAHEVCHSLLVANSTHVADLVRVGRLFDEMNDFVASKEAYTKALSIAPEFGHAEFGLGLSLFIQGDLPNAVTHLRRAVDLDPQDPARLTVLGVTLRDQGLVDEGLHQLEAAVAIDPTYEEAHFNIGVALRVSDPQRAVEHLRTAVRLDPAYGPAHRELGSILKELGQVDEAKSAFERAQALANARSRCES